MDYIVILHSFLAFKQDIPASQVLFGLELRSLRHGLLHFRGCFKRNRLGATCLTEDLEFTMKLALNNYKVAWAHNAVVYDEKPITLKQSWNQRKRWMQGHADCASRYLGPLFKKAFREGDLIAFDCAVYLFQPIRLVFIGLITIMMWIQTVFPESPFIILSMFFPQKYGPCS